MSMCPLPPNTRHMWVRGEKCILKCTEPERSSMEHSSNHQVWKLLRTGSTAHHHLIRTGVAFPVNDKLSNSGDTITVYFLKFCYLDSQPVDQTLCLFKGLVPSTSFYLLAEIYLVPGIPLAGVRVPYFSTIRLKTQIFDLIKSSV